MDRISSSERALRSSSSQSPSSRGSLNLPHPPSSRSPNSRGSLNKKRLLNSREDLQCPKYL